MYPRNTSLLIMAFPPSDGVITLSDGVMLAQTFLPVNMLFIEIRKKVWYTLTMNNTNHPSVKYTYTENKRLLRELEALEAGETPDSAYLRSRLRPALEELIRSRRMNGLYRLAELNIISPQLAGQYAQLAAGWGNPEAAALLYQYSPKPADCSHSAGANGRIPSAAAGNSPEGLALRVLFQCRKELSLALPGLSAAFYALVPCSSQEHILLETDGRLLYYQPESLLCAYRRDPCAVNRLYFHEMLHCLFHHPDLAGQQEAFCDDAVNTLLARLELPCIHTGSALRDDHRFWGKRQDTRISSSPGSQDGASGSGSGRDGAPAFLPPQAEALLKRRLLACMQEIREPRFRRSGTGAGNGLAYLTPKKPPVYDYGTLLRLWAVTREERSLDPDSFDPISYTAGLARYGNIPLIEPLETREMHKLCELVIALDTSGSCSGERIRRFLDETWALLCSDSWFFREMNLHILQCDSMIQADVKLTSREELRAYGREIAVQGFGGTDFRPVFSHVEELIRKKEFTRLSGIIYFTDGQGIFPEKKPPVETAFVLTSADADQVELPDWALRVRLPERVR